MGQNIYICVSKFCSDREHSQALNLCSVQLLEESRQNSGCKQAALSQMTPRYGWNNGKAGTCRDRHDLVVHMRLLGFGKSESLRVQMWAVLCQLASVPENGSQLVQFIPQMIPK